jgi:murein DD-endopeptidase MepM/ murein hydrolase activator NlpD
MGDPGMLRPAGAGLTRREVLHLGALAAAAALVPATAAAAPPDKKPGSSPILTPLENPYTGSIPLIFPVADGTYRKPFRDNWHDNREGPGYDWSHQNSAVQRAHDGVDIFPRFAGALPTAYAPFAARVVEVNVDGYRRARDAGLARPWDYGQGDIYGNYLWLSGTEGASAGYFALYCHLQDESILRSLADTLATAGSLTVTAATAVGAMGETGNAAGQPQLHVELHLPTGKTFLCTRCDPDKSPLTAFNPFPSLSKATARP